MAINLGSNAALGLRLGTATVTEAYLGSTKVFPPPSGVATATISNSSGNIKTAAGTFSATQFSTSGSGTGATFTVTIDSNRTATAFTITNAGSGYTVSDTIELQIASLPANFQIPRVQLTVATLGY